MRINEIFYSLQGEGRFTGTPAVFVRFAGCNLKCGFCDTEHNPHTEMTEEEVIAEVNKYPAMHVVLTGGEPTLQLTASLVNKLHAIGKYVAIETNGTNPITDGLDYLLDWVTVSPKYKPLRIQRIDELKVVFQGQDMAQYDRLSVTYKDCWYLQPCDTKNEEENVRNLSDCINFIKANPKWKLSLQTQKILNVR